jgi:hypothetical protein
MATWAEVNRQAPAVAAAILARFMGHPHHVLGTLTRDGSPRLSGINVMYDDEILWFGCMPASRKGTDIERDHRISLHSAPLQESLEGGDAVISGFARLLPPDRVLAWRPETPANGVFYEVDISSLHLVEVFGKDLSVTMWDTEHGVRSVNRQ